MRAAAATWLIFVALFAASPCAATPGPDSVALLANLDEPNSQALLDDYGRLRHIPVSQRCTVRVKPFVDLDAKDFRSTIALPLLQCLLEGKALDRIESIVLLRGMPRRVAVDFGDGTLKVSLAAALSIYRTVIGKDEAPLVGKAPGIKGLCGNGVPCWAATWKNPYDKGPFSADWQRKTGQVSWRMWLVTAIDGYTDEDARKLITAANAAAVPDLKAQWLLMKGADKARGVLDAEYAKVAEQLSGYLPNPVVIEKFSNDLEGRKLGAFVTGTAKLGKTIEGNTFSPGALVDNLTSLGAVPTNFNAPEIGGQQAQVSVCRWVRAGATGVHGTVAEPLNNCFPSRQFLVDYAAGATLAEAFWRNLPFVYWMNLVLGDPMVAPFAKRPKVAIDSVDGLTQVDGDLLGMPASGTVRLRFTADGGGDPIGTLKVFVDGAEAASVTDASVEVEVAVGNRHIVAVAQAAPSNKGAGVWRSKGWAGWFSKAAVKRGGQEGKTDTKGDPNDATTTDPKTPKSPPPASDGCNASHHNNRSNNLLILALFVVAFATMPRRESQIH